MMNDNQTNKDMKQFEFDGESMDISIEEFIEMNQLSDEVSNELKSMEVGDKYPFPIGGGYSVLKRIQ